MFCTKRSIGSYFRLGFVFAAAGFLPVAIQAGETCGDNDPANPTPQFQGSVELWPDNFQPAVPNATLPLNRDSSQYKSTTYPSAGSGHELFWAIAAVDPWVFVAYNVGIQAWNVEGTNAAVPERVHFRDGIAGQWLFHPPPGESDGYIHDIDAIQDPNNSDNIIVAVAATNPVGVSIWKFSRSGTVLVAAYQQSSRESTDVELVNFNGNIYALYAGNAGPFVVDASAAVLLGGCLDTACPSTIYRGKIGTAVNTRYISGIVRNGNIYAMGSFGGIAGNTPFPELWEIADPTSPTTAVRRFVGTVKDTHGVTLFKKGVNHYLAVVENKRVKIYNVDDCLDTSGCTGLPTALFDHALRNQNWLFNYLTHSQSNGTDFLYYGCECNFLSNDAVERLFDLSNLGGSNIIPEITATGGTYSDNDQPNTPCTTTHTGIGYWSHQYSNNRYGLRNFNPRKGVFNGNYFYRVAQAVFDVHVRGAVTSVPSTTTSTASAPPYWFGEPVNFVATAQNCPGAESWTWSTDPYTWGVTGTGPNDATATLTWNLCNTGDCSSFTTNVWAVKTACSGDSNLEINDVSVTLSDPRPRIRSINVAPAGSPPDTYPLCSVLSFTSTIDGKSPFTYQWTARTLTGEPVASSSSANFVWDTEGVVISTEIFDDGFESGDTSQWIVPLPSARRPTVAEIVRGGGGSAVFNVELVATNPNTQQDTETKQITIVQLGAMGFGSPEITATNLGNGQYRFVANTQNATSWRWEFEDPANGTTGACLILPAAKCSVIAAGADDNDVTFRWLPTNTDGFYGVAVQIDNCEVLPVNSNSAFEVNVTGITIPNPPTITEFRVNPTAWNPGTICEDDSAIANSYFCRANQAVPFIIGSTNATHLQLDWDRDGVYESEVAFNATVTKQWADVGPLPNGKPRVRARSGSELSAPVDLLKSMTITP